MTCTGDLAKQLASTLSAAFAAACCLGVAAALSALAAVGAGFLINDAVLIPLYVAFLALSLWLLYRSANSSGCGSTRASSTPGCLPLSQAT
jgi:mercuric ion transport protein